MASTIKELTKDVWTKVLTNVTNLGMVSILDQKEYPTAYLIALVPTGEAAPDPDFDGGISFLHNFSPSNSVASDYYVMPKGADGKVVVLT